MEKCSALLWERITPFGVDIAEVLHAQKSNTLKEKEKPKKHNMAFKKDSVISQNKAQRSS